MKKVLLFFAAAAMAVSASAGTLYCVGSGTVNGKSLPGGPNGACVAVTSDTDTYTFDVSGLGWLKISDTNASDWATFNKNGFTINGKGDYALSANDLGKTFNLWWSNGSSEGTNNINTPTDGDYVYTIKTTSKGTSTSTLVVTAKSAGPIIYDIYLRGSWDPNYAPQANYKFTPDADGIVYTLSDVTLSEGTKFKIADANWGGINYGGAGNVKANEEYTLTYNGADMTLAQDIKNATITFNVNNNTMYIKDTSAPNIEVKPDYSSWYVHIGGAFNNNDFYNNGINPVDGVASFSNLAIGNGTFKVHVWNSEEGDVYYINDGDQQVPAGEWVQFVKDAYDIYDYVAGASADAVFDAQYNVETNQLFLTLVKGTIDTETPGKPDAFGIVGSMQSGDGWDVENPIEMTADNNVWTATFDSLSADTQFKIATVGKGWNDTYGAEFNAAEQTGDETVDVELGTPMSAFISSSHNWVITEDLTDVTITFTYVADGQSTVTVTGTKSTHDEPTYPENFYIVGDFNSWNPADGTALNNEGDGFFSIEGIELTANAETSYIAFFTEKIGWDEGAGANSYRYGAKEANNGKTGGDASYVIDNADTEVEVDMVKGSEISWGLPVGIYTINVSFEDMIVTFEKTGDIETPEPTDMVLYLVGAANDWKTDEEKYKMTHEEGTNIYTYTGTTIFTGKWKICDGTWDWSFGMGDDFKANFENDCWFDGQDFNAIELDNDQEVHLTFTLVSGSDVKDCGIPSKVLYTITTGVDGIEIDEAAPAEYYNLQGVRIAAPEKGLYIIRQGEKVTKILK